MGRRFNSRHMFFTLFDPDLVLVASNCTYINNTRHMIVRVAVCTKSIAPSREARPQHTTTCSLWRRLPSSKQDIFIHFELTASNTHRIRYFRVSCQHVRPSGQRCCCAAAYRESHADRPPRLCEHQLMTVFLPQTKSCFRSSATLSITMAYPLGLLAPAA